MIEYLSVPFNENFKVSLFKSRILREYINVH